MLRKILLSAVALSLVAGSAAMAQDNAPASKPADEKPMPRGFQALDVDKDGFISLEEFGKRRIDNLKAADANGDGELSMEELIAHIQKRDYERRARAMTRMLDVDGDGKVTIAEIEKQNAKRLALLDANDDGKVSPEELMRAHRFMGKRQGPVHDHDHGRFEGRGGRGGDRHAMMEKHGPRHGFGPHDHGQKGPHRFGPAKAPVDAPIEQ